MSLVMSSNNCSCQKYSELAEAKIFQLSHRLNLVINQSPQYSRDILIWLKSICEYVGKFETMLIEWENKGSLDLECSQCKYTKKTENNLPQTLDTEPCWFDIDN